MCITAVAGLVATNDCSRKSLQAAPSGATDAVVVGSQFIGNPASSNQQNAPADRTAAGRLTSGQRSRREILNCASVYVLFTQQKRPL